MGSLKQPESSTSQQKYDRWHSVGSLNQPESSTSQQKKYDRWNAYHEGYYNNVSSSSMISLSCRPPLRRKYSDEDEIYDDHDDDLDELASKSSSSMSFVVVCPTASEKQATTPGGNSSDDDDNKNNIEDTDTKINGFDTVSLGEDDFGVVVVTSKAKDKTDDIDDEDSTFIRDCNASSIYASIPSQH